MTTPFPTYDVDGGLEKAGASPGILRLSPGDEVTLVVTGPTLDVLDRFGKKTPTRKNLVGTVIVDSTNRSHVPGTRVAVLLSWRSLNEWKQEGKRRPFSKNLARYSRVGKGGRDDTKYTISCVGPIPPNIAQMVANAAPVEEFGTFEVLAAAMTKRTEESVKSTPIDDSEAEPKEAPAASGTPPYAPYAGPPVAPVAPVPAAVPGKLTVSDHLAELAKIDGWLQDPKWDPIGGSEHLKAVLMASIGKDVTLKLVAKVGIVRGGALATPTQLRALVAEAVAVLKPQGIAAGAGIDEDAIPF